MTLDSGVFCLVNGSPKPANAQLSGVRVSSLDPADPAVSISTFRPDGWLSGGGESALIRVLREQAQILITIYQPAGSTDTAPKLRVLRLSEASGEAPSAPDAPEAPAGRKPIMILTEPHDVIAHIQRAGDVGHSFGEWVGEPGKQMAVEGFSLTAPEGLTPADLTYQAVLGRGWLSPWNEAGQFCGSRGMALPILGFKLKLSEDAAKRFALSISATFLDGTRLDDLTSEQSVEAPSLSPLEAFRINLVPKAAGNKPARNKTAEAKKPTPTVKPAPTKAGPPAKPKAGKPRGR
jgi:hypothetical protein